MVRWNRSFSRPTGNFTGRNMIREWMLLLLFIVPSGTSQESQCPHNCIAGDWSKTGRQAPGPQLVQIPSPDGRSVIHTDGDFWWLECEGKRLPGKKFALGPWREFGWAPDSQAFYLTQSEGFTTGYHMEIYRLAKGRVIRLSQPDDLVRRDFERRHSCWERGPLGWLGNDPNRAGLSWVQNSSEVLIVAEVPPIGICKEPAYFGGYLISLATGRITARYSPQTLMAQWNSVIGARLKGDFEGLRERQKTMAP